MSLCHYPFMNYMDIFSSTQQSLTQHSSTHSRPFLDASIDMSHFRHWVSQQPNQHNQPLIVKESMISFTTYRDLFEYSLKTRYIDGIRFIINLLSETEIIRLIVAKWYNVFVEILTTLTKFRQYSIYEKMLVDSNCSVEQFEWACDVIENIRSGIGTLDNHRSHVVIESFTTSQIKYFIHKCCVYKRMDVFDWCICHPRLSQLIPKTAYNIVMDLILINECDRATKLVHEGYFVDKVQIMYQSIVWSKKIDNNSYCPPSSDGSICPPTIDLFRFFTTCVITPSNLMTFVLYHNLKEWMEFLYNLKCPIDLEYVLLQTIKDGNFDTFLWLKTKYDIPMTHELFTRKVFKHFLNEANNARHIQVLLAFEEWCNQKKILTKSSFLTQFKQIILTYLPLHNDICDQIILKYM